MLRASISYTREDGRAQRLVTEMQPAQYPLLKWSGMELTYSFGSEHAGSIATLCKSALYGYQNWAESPAALTLRALHNLQTTCQEHVPGELHERGVVTMQISIDYRVTDKDEFVTVDSVSIHAEPGSSAYIATRTGELTDTWPIEMTHGRPAPLSLATELLTAEIGPLIDLNSYPAAQRVAIDADVLLHQEDVRSIVPAYARAAFGVFMRTPSRPSRSKDLVGRHQVWEMFRRT
jgi:hypothetical protein